MKDGTNDTGGDNLGAATDPLSWSSLCGGCAACLGLVEYVAWIDDVLQWFVLTWNLRDLIAFDMRGKKS